MIDALILTQNKLVWSLALFVSGPMILFPVLSTLYFHARYKKRAPREAPAGLGIDVLVTVCGESLGLSEQSLRAALGIRYPHET